MPNIIIVPPMVIDALCMRLAFLLSLVDFGTHWFVVDYTGDGLMVSYQLRQLSSVSYSFFKQERLDIDLICRMHYESTGLMEMAKYLATNFHDSFKLEWQMRGISIA